MTTPFIIRCSKLKIFYPVLKLVYIDCKASVQPAIAVYLDPAGPVLIESLQIMMQATSLIRPKIDQKDAGI